MNNTETLSAAESLTSAKESAEQFLTTIFGKALELGCGEIEIRVVKPYQDQLFSTSIEQASDKAMQLSTKGIDAYFGVNLKTGKGGARDNVKYLSCFHAEVDYGPLHNKPSKYQTYDESLNAIKSFTIPPTIIVHSGGGFHCYWVLNEPLSVSEYGVAYLESINKGLCIALGGDIGTHDISRILRVPGTFNYKLENNPRPVTLIENTGAFYSIHKFKHLIEEPEKTRTRKAIQIALNVNDDYVEVDPDSIHYVYDSSPAEIDIDSLSIPEKFKHLILNGNNGTYPSRSEADMAIITILIKNGHENLIYAIFDNFPIGSKYKESSEGKRYLSHCIDHARKYIGLTETELLNPLFMSGALNKKDDTAKLSIVNFQEYIVRKHNLRVFDGALFKYTGFCYDKCTENDLNYLCQQELGMYRGLFSKSALSDFIHYSVGSSLIDRDKAVNDQLNYIPFKNGLLSLDTKVLIDHTPELFITNLMPYEYDTFATCPRFMQYLDEVFMGDKDKIRFVQEAVGYGFHKAIPEAALFLLVGEGSNGKSVFIDTITELFGEHNTCSISLNLLSNELYVHELFGKMINISSETPRKNIHPDTLKAVVGGDWITGRLLYRQPIKFKPITKHFVATNDMPDIKDQSHGMWRRINIIDFPRTFDDTDKDTDIRVKLKAELPGIFNWAMEGYERLKTNRFVFSSSKSMERSKLTYRDSMNHVLHFVNDCLVANQGTDTKFSELYERFVHYCSDMKIKEIPNRTEFRKALVRNGFRIENSTAHGNQIYVMNASLVEKD